MTAEDYLPASSHSSLIVSTSPNPEDRRNTFNIKNHPTSGQVFGCGETFMDQCDKDRYTEMRKGHLYYPFTSRDEWELASFLLCSRLSMAAVDRFLKLKLLFWSAEGAIRVYTEWLSGNAAWEMQDSLPQGATLFGTVLSSDKTNISAMTGNCMAHPLLISLANLKMNFRMKSSNHAFLLLALLPVPSFIHQKSVYVACWEIGCIGIMMSNPLGWRWFCFTPLAAYIIDTPESTLIAGVAGRTSSVTMGSYKQLGDNFRHEPCTASTTLAQLHVVEEKADPWDLEAYFKAASQFLSFWDHDAKWCINTVGAAELDFCFSILHQHVGFRQFKEGISSLKQVTGYAVPPDFLVAIQSLMDFHYLAQSMQIDEPMCAKIDAALKEFHTHKDLIIAAGARRGKNHVIDNWYIPKLEFLQSVVPSIRANGIALQWSADGMECAHIEVIKDSSDFSNNQKFESQICQHLDHIEKCQRFDLFTAVCDAKVDFCARFSTNGSSEEDNSNCASVASDDSTIETTANLVNQINPVSALSGKSLPSHIDYFAKAADLKKNPPSGRVPQAQPHTFSSPQAAFHLNRDPSFNKPINDIATLFNIPDLHEALSNYIQCITNANDGYIRVLGGRRSASQGSQLPFTHLQVWKKHRLQNKAYHFPHETLPSKTVNACPPSDPDFEWPHSRLEGHQVAELCLIFHMIQCTRSLFHGDCFLTYARRFDIVPQINKNISGSSTARGPYPEAKSSLYILKRARRANGKLIGDILPLQQVRAPVDLTPCFGNVADHRLTKYNSSTYCSEFRLNKYFDKELYLSLS
ncbi:hypothetical protein BYT27DRAFT_7261911 [Phlegmacium glaucopus]|nr:hypothetical protein BYT27DRAFT_7261911 [Phlegmacium glaucopus]